MLNIFYRCKIIVINVILILVSYLHHYFKFFSLVPKGSFMNVFLDITVQTLQSAVYAEDLLWSLGRPGERDI